MVDFILSLTQSRKEVKLLYNTVGLGPRVDYISVTLGPTCFLAWCFFFFKLNEQHVGVAIHGNDNFVLLAEMKKRCTFTTTTTLANET